jgi:hypothetical protein
MSACRRLGYDEARSSAARDWEDFALTPRLKGGGGSMSIVTILIIVVVVLLVLAIVGRGRF